MVEQGEGRGEGGGTGMRQKSATHLGGVWWLIFRGGERRTWRRVGGCKEILGGGFEGSMLGVWLVRVRIWGSLARVASGAIPRVAVMVLEGDVGR